MAGSKSSLSFVREATGLTKRISSLDALGMSLSGMGLLYVFNVVAFTPAFYPEANPLIGPFIGLLLVLPVAGMYALLAIAMPRTGGDYVWTSRILTPGLGYVVNFTITIISLSFIGSVGPWFPQWSLGEMFYDLGKIYGSSNFLSIANYLQTSVPTFWITAFLIVLAGAVVIVSTRLASAIVKYWTILAFIIGAIFVGTALTAGSSTFAQNFNALSGAKYDDIVSAGQQAGAFNGVPSALSYPSLYSGALGLLGYLAFFYPSYFAGEVRQNKRTQIIAQIGASVIFAIFTTIIIFAEYFGEGPSFVNAMAALWISGSSSYPYISIPLASGLSMFWTQNPLLIAIFNLSFGMTVEVMNIAILFSLSRNIFAWSFDRIIPTTFASLNSRTRTPVNATILMTVVALAFAYIAIFQSGTLAAVFSYGTAGIFLAFVFVSIAAIAYPYRRREIFDTIDPTAKTKIGGVPFITVLGVLSLIVSLITVYAIVLPSIGGPFVTVLFEGIIPTFIIGGIIYSIAFVIRRRENIDLNLIAKTIPPE